jgi:hypothetical protein
MIEHVRCSPLRKPLKAKQVQKRLEQLGIHLKPAMVGAYLKEIHDSAEQEAARDLVMDSF